MSHSFLNIDRNNTNDYENIINRINLLNSNMNKKEDDIKNIINEKDDIIQKIKNKLLAQEKELKKNKNEIKNLSELIEKINKENKKKDKKLLTMNDKLLNQEKIINDYKNKINGLDKKIFELKNNENNYKKELNEIIQKIEEQKNKNDKMNFIMKNNINQNFYDMSRFNNNMLMNMNNIGGFQINQNQNKMPEKKCIIFKSMEGDTKILNFDLGTTINEILMEYIKKINNSKNINNDYEFSFLFNGNQLHIGDNTKIEQYFRDCYSPYILVMKRKI